MKRKHLKHLAGTLLIFTMAFFVGAGAGKFVQSRREKAVSASAEGNWGLSFPQEGQTPVGNATPDYLKQFGAYYVQNTDDKVLYLTFDAGYENGNTAPILDALKKHNAPATFFVVGNYISTSPDLVKRMVAEGHTVANHTNHHPDMSKISTKDAFAKELNDLENIKEKAEGYSGAKERVLEVSGLQSDAGIKPFDFYINKGEVNGFTGLLGSGRSECVRAIFSADKVTGGTVKKNGKTVKITKPLDAMKNGIAYLPEDRKNDGIVGDLSVRENIILAAQVLKGFFKPFSRAEANRLAEEYIKLLEIKTASADTPIKSLSGGNQQKVILARWLLTHPEYLILDEPTRGIDIGTKIEIQKLVLKLAAEGMSVTFISSETDEMLHTCSRLIVMRDRKMVGELSGDDLNQVKIMETIAGGEMG